MAEPELPNSTSGFARSLWDIASTVLLALLVTLTVNTSVARAWVVDGPSMQPNLFPIQGDLYATPLAAPLL